MRNTGRGTLYGVGVGPGDPELLTLKAARIISTCDVVAYPANLNGHSQARTIAAAFIKNQQEIPIKLSFSKDRQDTLNAYDAAAQQISATLAAGFSVAVLCEGDPLLFGSFIYLLDRLSHHPIIIIPGISSIMAAAAAAQCPLAQINQSLKIVPATCEPHILDAALGGNDPIAILKLGPRRGHVLKTLENNGRLQDAVYVEYTTRDNERIVNQLNELDPKTPAPYFSLMLVRGRS